MKKYVSVSALSNAMMEKADAQQPKDEWVRGYQTGLLKAACMLESAEAADVIKVSRAHAKAPVVIAGNICDLRCPDCNARVGMSYHYCWQCGQKLDLTPIHGYA